MASNGPFSNDYIYFGARMMPLESQDDFNFYAISYLGSAAFAHSEKAFDALIGKAQFDQRMVSLELPHGLINSWLERNSYKNLRFGEGFDYGDSAVFSYNSGDVDGDNKPDFIFEEELILSTKEYQLSTNGPRRALFVDDFILGVEGNNLWKYSFNGKKLIVEQKFELNNHPHDNVPYVLLPLPDGNIGVRTNEAFDIYSLRGDDLEWFATITGLSPGELQTGAFGDFTGNGAIDVWLAQVVSPTPYPDKSDQIILLQMSDIKPGTNVIDDIAWTTIRGSSKYSDYDGIGTSLSPKAGDFDGDGKPDFSFTGHRHMNEAGALYILPGSSISRHKDFSISDEEIVKILGRQMSQLAPPFHHWDFTDFNFDGHADIIVTADNDMCSGLHAGSVLKLDGKRIFDAWSAMQ